ncbi:MAG: CHRD domain-containing protein [Bacteroidota bacterium]
MKSKYKAFIAIGLAGLILSILWMGCKKEYHNSLVDLGIDVYTGTATTAMALPAKTGSGTALLSATYDENNRVFNYTVNWSKLDSTATSIAIYGPNSAGQPYVITRTLATFAAPLPTGAAGSSQNTIFQLNAFSDFELINLKAGNCYFVVNTTASTTGAVRGKITYVRTFSKDN